MEQDILKRTTFVVADAKDSARFFENVFGWRIWYDNELKADKRFPPSGADADADVSLVILETTDPTIGKLGFLQYHDPKFDEGFLCNRSKIRMGEAILVIETNNVDRVFESSKLAGANVVCSPVDWEVPSPDGNSTIRLRSISLFDPNGIYMEVNQHL